jgi:predicted nuclease of restriction endonuclease-like (RecB) superfamily
MKLKELSQAIKGTDSAFSRQAGRSVNLALTLRNWLIGFYVKEYEQNGQDRAVYGGRMFEALADSLQKAKVSGCSQRSLRLYRYFYEVYPEVGRVVSAKLQELVSDQIWQVVPVKLPLEIWQSAPAKLASCLNNGKDQVLDCSVERLVKELSFSHFLELIKLQDPVKRSFYELEAVRSNWSTKELRRQISALYYERLGLTKDKEKLKQVRALGSYTQEIKDVIRDPYMFEFVDINKDDFTEASLAKTLLQQLNKFFLEMGRGFCFEASNKKILIGDQFFFVDLVLYHRVLKCHFLIELKVDEFNHAHASQLNTYVNYFKKHEMSSDDNPPVGLLLCTGKNEALVEYAFGGMSNSLFVSKYELSLPSSVEIKHFLENRLKELP